MDPITDSCGASLHQKRLLAFINHFLIRNVQFLNNFSSQCEEKLIGCEMKMNKVEASLKILEYQLNSIPGMNVVDTQTVIPVETQIEPSKGELKDEQDNPVEPEEQPTKRQPRDPIYDRFFKMVQVGVPVQAVKLKIIQEGLDPNVLEHG